ncbi:tyrosine-type recombinase/integrase [Nonomuraea roseoviolacea]|uniref:Integrase n=1 Tax=Nonomuraea roseoviolacea subsp. carminata TaxID=160689 RepID=A0ABT1KA52_9ACTN|nr:site-specific integrase [Nonomuraea roseoviolacea]MCP2350484.1 integrase [Nonomuraea roseoviolacea subsp. carminata]
MASLIKKCECADTKAGRTLDLRKADDRKSAERSWNKCGHSWVVRYRLGGRDAKQQEQSYPHHMRKDAEAFILEIKSDKVSGLRRVIDPKAGKVVFSDYADKWLAGRVLKPNTLERYRSYLRNHIKPALGHLKLSAIKRQHVKDLIAKMRNDGYAASTINGCYAVLNSVLDEAVRDKLLTDSPCTEIELPSAVGKKDFYVPTWAQIATLADAMPADWAAAIWLMAGCGLRIGEALAFNEDCLLFGGRRIRISQQVTQKHGLGPLKHREEGEYRDAPLPPFVNAVTTAHLDTHGTNPDGYLFQGRKNPYVNHEVFRVKFKAALKAAGMPEDFTIHGLRHAYASMQLSQGIPITDLSHWLGHKDINETYKTYAHLLEEAWDRALEVMETAYQEAITPVEDRAAC